MPEDNDVAQHTEASDFTPELGQFAFSNTPWQPIEPEWWVEGGLHLIAAVIEEVRGDDGVLTSNYGADPWESDTFDMRSYCWCEGEREGHQDGCPPNFVHHPTGTTICWYKHAGRGASIDRAVSPSEFAKIVTDCLDAVRRSRPVEEEHND